MNHFTTLSNDCSEVQNIIQNLSSIIGLYTDTAQYLQNLSLFSISRTDYYLHLCLFTTKYCSTPPSPPSEGLRIEAAQYLHLCVYAVFIPLCVCSIYTFVYMQYLHLCLHAVLTPLSVFSTYTFVYMQYSHLCLYVVLTPLSTCSIHTFVRSIHTFAYMQYLHLSVCSTYTFVCVQYLQLC